MEKERSCDGEDIKGIGEPSYISVDPMNLITKFQSNIHLYNENMVTLKTWMKTQDIQENMVNLKTWMKTQDIQNETFLFMQNEMLERIKELEERLNRIENE